MKRIGSLLLLLALGLVVDGFTSPISVQRHARPPICKNPHHQPPHQPPQQQRRSSSSTSLNVLGTDGGILGVGAPEIATILVVGYFVLGPSELYKLVKEIGKFIQNFRSLSSEATKQFESTMENQLELTELRKAQSELNDAFSFRRSINTDETLDAFAENSFSEQAAATAAAATTATATAAADGEGEEGTVKKKRRLVRRKKKKVVTEEEEEVTNLEREIAMEYPDLDMLDDEEPSADVQSKINEEDKLRAERMERLSGGSSNNDDDTDSTTTTNEPDWFTASEQEIASEVLNTPTKDPAMEQYEKTRFQSQLSAEDWNAQIMANEDALSPLAMVMQRLAILEEEKNAADRRLEEEYERRMDNEDKFYLEKRRVLEEAIEDIQRGAFNSVGVEKTEEGSVGVEVEKKNETVVNNGPKFSA